MLRNVPQGVHLVKADPPIAVEQNNFIGIYYLRSTAENVMAQAMLADDAVLGSELYEVYETPSKIYIMTTENVTLFPCELIVLVHDSFMGY